MTQFTGGRSIRMSYLNGILLMYITFFKLPQMDFGHIGKIILKFYQGKNIVGTYFDSCSKTFGRLHSC